MRFPYGYIAAEYSFDVVIQLSYNTRVNMVENGGSKMHDFARQMKELGRKQSRLMRDQVRATALKRKEEYLGARVPKDLREKVIAKADSLGIPVSILIRNILEEAFKDGAARESAHLKQVEVKSQRVRFPDVIGWETITLNRQMGCSGCSKSMPAGSVAAFGLGLSREDHVILCEKCRDHV